jgi:hypothetical protein
MGDFGFWFSSDERPSKVRTLFEGAQPFSKVRILENPEDFFEGAQPLPRCAPKCAHLRAGLRRLKGGE